MILLNFGIWKNLCIQQFTKFYFNFTLSFFFIYNSKDIPQRRVRRWGFSIHELLKDPVGRDLFRRFLEKEYSSENLRFYDLCNELRYATNKDVSNMVVEIYK
jgi:hypothetical protein